MAKRSARIDTVPLPEKPISVEFTIPPALLEAFGREVRIVVRHPWVIGIPVPERLLTPELKNALGKDFQFIVTPAAAKR